MTLPAAAPAATPAAAGKAAPALAETAPTASPETAAATSTEAAHRSRRGKPGGGGAELLRSPEYLRLGCPVSLWRRPVLPGGLIALLRSSPKRHDALALLVLSGGGAVLPRRLVLLCLRRPVSL